MVLAMLAKKISQLIYNSKPIGFHKNLLYTEHELV